MQANIDYGLGLKMATTAQKTIPKNGKAKVPLELEKGELPLNTYGNKTPFEGKILSVERIVGPKATGETTHIIIEHGGKMPYWEGQSYGVIPPVSSAPAPARAGAPAAARPLTRARRPAPRAPAGRQD